jgi:hypothetical protein
MSQAWQKFFMSTFVFFISVENTSLSSPLYLPLILSPMARRKFSIRTSVFLISGEYLTFLPLSPYSPLILSPMARRKFSIRTSVFLISVEKTSLPTMGQNGT